MVATGRVVKFDEVRGYGFIAPDGGGGDVFLHVNDLLVDKSLIGPGVHVRFDLEDGDRGRKASAVALVEHAAATTARSHAAADPRSGQDEVTCEVLSVQEFSDEVTEALLAGSPSLTGEQILAVRRQLVRLAMAHRWVDA
ncbi:cold shock domain-containing protein [Kitasatospora nipponensis]|uniref:Cold shock domain-containing protein n=1 Tax=Kitasatospora nipponensis TaxID=258049 RepID=A0ABP4GH52_9ACTN